MSATPAGDVPETTPSVDGASPITSVSPRSSSNSKFRTGALVALLFVMVGALWYDRMVARPAVKKTYDHIANLNIQLNGTAGRKYLTKVDIQREVGRAPLESFSENGYLVEVYGWRAGIPIRTHNYYAVYADGPPHVFLMHYMHELDRTDISRPPISVRTGPIDAPPPLFGAPGLPGGGSPRPPGDSLRRPPADDSSPPTQ